MARAVASVNIAEQIATAIINTAVNTAGKTKEYLG
jgi:hypothetical protein